MSRPRKKPSLASITFAITPEGKAIVDCNWSNDLEVAKLFAVLLFNINNGLYFSDINDVLTKKAMETKESIPFIKTLLEELKELMLNSPMGNLKTEPLVHPMKTFGASRIG